MEKQSQNNRAILSDPTQHQRDKKAKIQTNFLTLTSFIVLLFIMEVIVFWRFQNREMSYIISALALLLWSFFLIAWFYSHRKRILQFGEDSQKSLDESIRNANELQSSNERLEFILEGAGLGSWDWWLDSNKVQFDARWSQMLGLDPERTPQELSTWQTRVHPEDLKKCFEDITAHLEGKTSRYENIHRMRHEDGSWVWILDRGKISERDSKGRPLRFTGTHFDITSYKNQELLSSEIQKIGKIGGWVLDVATMTTKWTDQTYRIHEIPVGTPTNTLMGINFYVGEDKERISKHVEDALRGKSYQAHYRFRDAKGNFKWVEAFGEPYRNAHGEITKIVGTIQDITDKKENEIHLKETTGELLKNLNDLQVLKNQFEEAQKVAQIGNWSFNNETKQITWSKQMYELFPSSIESGPPTYQEHFATIHPEDRTYWENTVQEGLRSGSPYSMRFRVVYPDKTIKWIGAHGRALRDENQRIIGLSGTCQDITEAMITEENLAKERLKVLQSAKLKSLGELSAGIAHEINNPLAILNGSLALLNKHRHDASSIFDAKLAVAQRSLTRIARIVEGLRKFSRGSEEFKRELHELSPLIEGLVPILEMRSKRFEIPLEVDIQKNISIECDHMEIEQVIINLVNNSIDAIRNNSEKWIKVQIQNEKGFTVLRVIDSGTPPTPEIEARMFDPFFTTKDVGEGTGLGLSICKGILDRHTADIYINRSFPTTCFEIKFSTQQGVAA